MFKLFVRWNIEGDGYHRVDLMMSEKVFISSTVFCNNPDRAYGYCQGIVDLLKRFGFDVEMPQCLTGRHLCADISRED